LIIKNNVKLKISNLSDCYTHVRRFTKSPYISQLAKLRYVKQYFQQLEEEKKEEQSIRLPYIIIRGV